MRGWPQGAEIKGGDSGPCEGHSPGFLLHSCLSGDKDTYSGYRGREGTWKASVTCEVRELLLSFTERNSFCLDADKGYLGRFYFSVPLRGQRAIMAGA